MFIFSVKPRREGSIESRRAKLLAGVGILAAVSVWLIVSEVRRRGFDWRLFLTAVEHLDVRWLAAAAAFALATYYGRALRWAVLLHPLKKRPGIGNLLSATVIGFTAIVLLGRPGEFVRPYLIAAKERVPVSSQLAAWLIERIFDLLIALLVFGFALSQVRAAQVAVGPSLSWVMAVGGRLVAVMCVVCLVLILLFRHFGETMRRRLLDALRVVPAERYPKIEHLVTSFAQGMEAIRPSWALAALTLYTLLEWALIAGCYYCVAKAYGDELHFGMLDILIFMGFVSFGAVVQLPGVGGGVQVVSILVLTEIFGVPLEVATSLALLLWTITFVVIVPFGLAFAFHEGLNWNKIKAIGEETPI